VPASDRPRVSVIMPFYASAQFIAEAIESVRTQSFQAWELLLCDDGASDGSTLIARGYAELDPARVRWLEHAGHANRGASAARNLGIAKARGDFIAFLDADDVWLPRKLEEQVALLDANHEADALCGSTQFWFGWTSRPEDARLDHVLRIGPRDGALVPPPELLCKMLLGRIDLPCTCSLIVRSELVRRVSGFEESFRSEFTDQAFYAKLFREATVLVKDDMWDRYRQQPESSVAIAERTGELASTRLRYLRWFREYLTAKGDHDERLKRALDRAIWRVEHPRAASMAARWRRAVRRLRGVLGSARRVSTSR
jgi:glycosyltransferase involved in cell wall biosynthesis